MFLKLSKTAFIFVHFCFLLPAIICANNSSDTVPVTEPTFPTGLPIAKAGSSRPCYSDQDCSTEEREYCNTQLVDLLVPACPRGFCQCEPGFEYDASKTTCKNLCSTYQFGDVCSNYPSRLLPEGGICLNNTVVCGKGAYCPLVDKVRKKAYGEECFNISDCNHYSLTCQFEHDLRTKICKCSDREFFYDAKYKRCRRYSLGDDCSKSNYCGANSSEHKTGLTCMKNQICGCPPNTGKQVEITVPAVRIGASPSEAFVEAFDNIMICAPKTAKIYQKPGDYCDSRDMSSICDRGSFCLPCVDGCPRAICRALRLSIYNNNATLKSITSYVNEPQCTGNFDYLSANAAACSYLTGATFVTFICTLAFHFLET